MKNGVLYPDFVIEPDSLHPRCYHLIGIGSPGLTASLSIASELARIMRYKK